MGWVLNATPEFDQASEWRKIIAICVVLGLLSTSVVFARLWIRFQNRGLASDDWMSALSALFSLIYSALCIAQTRYGLGLPIKERPKENLLPYTKVNFAGRPVYQLGISFFKIALLISYLRLLNGTYHNTYRKIVWFTIALVFLAHLGCTLSLLFACKPVARSWNPMIDGTCLLPGPSFTGYAVVSIISDIVVALLPIPILMKLEVRLGKKLGLIGIFVLGLFTTICSIMRYTQIDQISAGDGNSTMLILWGTIEFNVGNMVSSLPFLAPLFLRKAREYRSKPSDGYDGTPSGRSRSHGLRSNHYRLDDMGPINSKDTGAFSSAMNKSLTGSEENMLQGGNGIVKSITYAVEMDGEGPKAKRNNSEG
ncbi:hypothetical protein FZEAL_1914 [Fusarium zealandicum]|uniref:Rhodopsin domain-containing protein n=1 Tax=Fusarium zealandicum TaxID=1053134 RepID=A0A8H4URW4_9HYPO|nr:hypothetical protein FZEAL_1914 [Fusarium zealandicum]